MQFTDDTAEFPIFECLRSCNNHLYQKCSNTDFPSEFPKCVPNTLKNDVVLSTCRKLLSKKNSNFIVNGHLL